MRLSGARSHTRSLALSVLNGSPPTAAVTPHCCASLQTGPGVGSIYSARRSMMISANVVGPTLPKLRAEVDGAIPISLCSQRSTAPHLIAAPVDERLHRTQI